MSGALADAESAGPPSDTYALLQPTDAAQFYEAACRSEGLHVHSTFLKQLLLGSVVIEFENGYLGGNGIVPIVQTLQRIPLRALLLGKCALSSEDVKLLCAGLTKHPQLEKIDVRGVDLTIGGVKELLHFVTRNCRIVEILMDDHLPKYVPIQQQCRRNAQISTSAMWACVMCNTPVATAASATCETLVLRFLLEHLKPHTRSISSAGLTVLAEALQHCVDRNDGVLTVCGEVCGEALAEDLCCCVWSVPKALVWEVPFDYPKSLFLRTLLTHQHKRFHKELATAAASAAASTSPQMPSASPTAFFLPGPTDAQAEEYWSTRKPRFDIDEFFDDCADRDVTPCSICGQPSVCSTDGATWLLRTLQLDVEEHGIAVTPAALLRVCRLFGAHARVRPCSRRCLRHLVRFALYGYGGVNCSYVGGFPPLSSVLGGVAELQRLPLVDFTVVDVAKVRIEDTTSEEINCALTVASAVSDTDGVPMDPYLIYSIGRQLRKMAPGSLGMDLAGACEAVRMVGCLPASAAPFQRLHGGPGDETVGEPESLSVSPRDVVANWAEWSAAAGEAEVRRWLHAAFAHRRQRVCAVDGPHRDLFDNIRAALWALRHQARSVLVTVKLAMAWLSLKDGVVPSTASTHTHGFCTSAKVVGQSTRDNTVYLILQCPLGKSVGQGGFLYLPKTLFLHCVRGMAFVFADAVTLEHREAGWRASAYGHELVGPSLGVADADVRRLRRVMIFLATYLSGRHRRDGAGWSLVGSRVPVAVLQRLFDADRLPEALSFLRDPLGLSASRSVVSVSGQGSGGAYCTRDVHRTYLERILLSSRYPSQLLFFFSEIAGSGEWLREALRAADTTPTTTTAATATGSGSAVQASAPRVAEREGAAWEQSPLHPDNGVPGTAVGGAVVSNDHTEPEERRWLTLGDVPDALPLTNLPASPAAGGTPGKAARTKKAAEKAAAPSPKPPLARAAGQSPPSTSRRRTIRLSTAPEEQFSPVLPGSPSAPPASPLKESTHGAENDGGRSLNAPVGANANASTSSLATSHDAVQERLEQSWKAERAARTMLLHDASRVGMVEYLRTRTQAARGQPTPLVADIVSAGAGGGERAKTHDEASSTRMSSEATAAAAAAAAASFDAIPVRLLGKPWSVVPVCHPSARRTDTANDAAAAATTSDLYMIFIGDSMAIYSLPEERLLCSPVAMGADALTANFPFATGVDAVAQHPTERHRSFFFSGQAWLLMDSDMQECVDGPYPLSVHGQFRKLPAAFHDGVDSVIAIPDSSCLVFFRDLCYVVFDVAARRCVGGVGRLNAPQSRRQPTGGAVPAGAPLTMTAAHEDSVESGCALHLSDEVQDALGTAPMTSLTTITAAAAGDGADGEAVCSHYLVSRTGRVVEVRWERHSNEEDDGTTAGEHSARPRSSSTRWELRCCSPAASSSSSPKPLAHLPVVFRQSSPSAVPALCAAALQTNFTLDDVQPAAADGTHTTSSLSVFDPEHRSGRGDRLSHSTDVAAGGEGDGSDARGRASSLSGTVDSRCGPTNRSTEASTIADDSDAVQDTADIQPSVTITSSLRPTALAERVPLGLSRCGAIHSASDAALDEAEIFYHGDGSAASSLSSSSSGARRYIEYDLGCDVSRRTFAALLLVLDTSLLPASVLRLAPLSAAVESSVDGEVFSPVASVRVAGPVTATKWADGPLFAEPVAARFWRLRFLTPLPTVVGVMRLIWFEAHGSPASLSSAFVPLPACTPLPLHVQRSSSSGHARSSGAPPIGIEAVALLAAPQELFHSDNVMPVFVDDPSAEARGWYGQHTAFPLLGQGGGICLMCCGDYFTEVRVDEGGDGSAVASPVSAACAQAFAGDVRFAGLPYPFVLGWDATFYPSPQQNPALVCLIRAQGMVLWDMDEGKVQGEVMPWRHSALFDGLAVTPMARIIATVNCWAASESQVIGIVYTPSSVDSSTTLYYLEFDLGRQAVVRAAAPFAAYLRSCCGAALPATYADEDLLTVLRAPTAPLQLFLFYKESVQTVDIHPGGGSKATWAVSPLRESSLFYTVPLLLPKWATRQRQSRIVVDMALLLGHAGDDSGEPGDKDGMLVGGMQLISSGGIEGSVARWQVQCSQQGRHWEDVAVHQQAAGERVVAETAWVPRAAGLHCQARFWRFLRLTSDAKPEKAGTLADPETSLQSYSQLRLLGVPRRRLTAVPARVAGADATDAACSAFFAEGTRHATLPLRRRSGGAASFSATVQPATAVYELLWDYGFSLVALCGAALRVEEKPSNVELTWTLCCSADADARSWTTAASAATPPEGTRCCLSWLPEGPYRYWRLRCVATSIDSHTNDAAGCPASLTLSGLRLFSYDGPLVSMQNSAGGHRNATSCLWPSALDSAATAALVRSAYSVLQFTHVRAALTSCVVDYLVSGSCTATVSVEWSSDATRWHPVARVTAGATATGDRKVQSVALSWRSCGAQHLWRVRVLDKSSDATLTPVRLRLGTSPSDPRRRLTSPELQAMVSPTATTAAARSASSPVAAPPAALPTPSQRSLLVSEARAPLSPSGQTEAPAETPDNAGVVELVLSAPQRLVGVRATLPSAGVRYAVEYLGLDGASWLSAAVLHGKATPTPVGRASETAAAVTWWDAAAVSPSTRWRLRPLSKAPRDSITPSPSLGAEAGLKPRSVEWLADSGACAVAVNTATVPGVMVSTTGFTEVQRPHLLSGGGAASGSARPSPLHDMPVLQCSVNAADSSPRAASGSADAVTGTATWSFISPLALDQLTLHVRATPAAVDADGAAGGSGAVQQVWVETSDNGTDYVVIAQTLWWPRDTVLILTWEAVPPAAFWRLRLASPKDTPSSTMGYTLDLFAAVWAVRRTGPALISSLGGALLGSFSNTVYRAWLTERFNNEAAFMRDCQGGFDELRSTETKLRAADDLSPAGQAAAAVQKLKAKLQSAIQKAAKEAARQSATKAETTAEKAAVEGDGAAAGRHSEYAGWLSPARATSDLMLLLLECAASPVLGGEHLLQLAEFINHPLALRDAYRFTKKPARWFYPALELVGQAHGDWYGFAADSVCASFCVYWSLSTALQRRRDVLLAPGDSIAPLSEHVASPLVVVQVDERGWSPQQHFPGVPSLYAAGFHEQPVTVVLALNDVMFAPPYTLGIPSARDSQALTSPFPYTVYAGANFLQLRSLGSCPAPVFDVLRHILPPSLFSPAMEEKPKKAAAAKGGSRRRSNRKNSSGSGLVLMVLSTGTALERDGGTLGSSPVTAHLRFTVPATGIDLGLRGLVMDSLEFEVAMTGDTLGAQPWTQQVNFVTHGAMLAMQDRASSGGATQVPVSIMGCVEMRGLPILGLRGSFGSARLPVVDDIAGAVLTEARFSALAQLQGGGGEDLSPRWVCSPLQCEAQLLLPGMPASYACACTLTPASSASLAAAAWGVTGLQVALPASPLSEVQAFCRACRPPGDGSARGRVVAATSPFPTSLASVDLCGLDVRLAACLSVESLPAEPSAQRRLTLHGQGILYLDNNALQDTRVEMDPLRGVVTVTASCAHPLRLGAVDVSGSEEEPMSLHLTLTDGARGPSTTRPAAAAKSTGLSSDGVEPPFTHRLLVAGRSHLFGREQTASVSLELTRSADAGHLATLLTRSLRHRKLCATLQDSVATSAWRYAQVTVDDAALRQALAREVGNAPIVAALCAQGVPLTCVVASVAAAPFDLAVQRLTLRVKGMLFGAAFDAVTSIACPDDVDDLWSLLAAHLCPEVVEQCEEHLWASYANVVGCRALPAE